MSREIEFRAWDIERKIFVSEGEIVFKNYGDTRIEVIPNCLEYVGDKCHNGESQGNRFVIEQYTGLKDKNGVKIFEGDILSVELSGKILKVPVVFKNGCFQLNLLDNNNKSLDYEDFTEVLGNIHENKELLN